MGFEGVDGHVILGHIVQWLEFFECFRQVAFLDVLDIDVEFFFVFFVRM